MKHDKDLSRFYEAVMDPVQEKKRVMEERERAAAAAAAAEAEKAKSQSEAEK